MPAQAGEIAMTERDNTSTVLIGLLAARPYPANRETLRSDSAAAYGHLLRLINERIDPPVPLTTKDVHIRTLRLISDEVNDHGGRFPRDEHEHLCELLIDTPVLIGHDRSGLPVARNFAARCVTNGDRQWVEVSFYWLRGPFGDRLAADIDGGVVKEGSIGFEFRRPECSICGADIRRCEHIPHNEYADADGITRTAHYAYRDVVRVLETSLVYRGATPGTRFVDHEAFCKIADNDADQSHAGTPITHAVVLGCYPQAHGDHRYLISRRDPDDPDVCDEIVICSPSVFHVGERLTRHQGQWLTTTPARDTDDNIPSSSLLRTPAPTVGPRLAKGGRPTLLPACLKRVFGSGNPVACLPYGEWRAGR